MTWRSGFWDSIGGDRTYSASDMAIPFDGVITDGVFANWGDAYKVTPNDDGKKLIIGSGKAWKNGRWTLNDSKIEKDLNLDGTWNNATKTNWIILALDWKIENVYRMVQLNIFDADNDDVYGTLNSFKNTPGYNVLPIAYVEIPPACTAVNQTNITSLIGSAWCPYVTSPVQSVTVDDIRNKWDTAYRGAAESTISSTKNEASQALRTFRTDFDVWFASVKTTLAGDQAANLKNQIDDLRNSLNLLVSTGQVVNSLEFWTNNKLESANLDNGQKIDAVTKFVNM